MQRSNLPEEDGQQNPDSRHDLSWVIWPRTDISYPALLCAYFQPSHFQGIFQEPNFVIQTQSLNCLDSPLSKRWQVRLHSDSLLTPSLQTPLLVATLYTHILRWEKRGECGHLSPKNIFTEYITERQWYTEINNRDWNQTARVQIPTSPHLQAGLPGTRYFISLWLTFYKMKMIIVTQRVLLTLGCGWVAGGWHVLTSEGSSVN